MFLLSEHPALADLGERLRELAGDAAYAAGRDYFKKGLVRHGAVAGSTAFASVSGSTEYRVSIAFAGEVKVTCSCPAHRRSKYCKHVVAVFEALLQQPGAFAVTSPAVEVAVPARAKRSRKAGGKEEAQGEQRSAGLETLDRLLEELAAGGLMSLGPEKADLIAGTGELVRALKLRRLGNIVAALPRQSDPGAFARLVCDLYVTRAAVGAHLEGRVALDPTLAEELLGKVWRDGDLTPVSGPSLMEVGFERVADPEFRVETSYLVDIGSGELYVEKQITPVKLGSAPKSSYRHRIVVEEAGLYPGPAPRRIKLVRGRRAVLSSADVAAVVAGAVRRVAQLRALLAARLASPFGAAELPVLVRPSVLVTQGSLAGLVDEAGSFLRVSWPAEWSKELAGVLPESGEYALFGLLSLDGAGPELRCLSVLSPDLRWGRGPVFPDK